MKETDDKQKLADFTHRCIITMLLLIVLFLLVQLSKSWRNERFLDATINKYTTTSTNHIK